MTDKVSLIGGFYLVVVGAAVLLSSLMEHDSYVPYPPDQRDLRIAFWAGLLVCVWGVGVISISMMGGEKK